MLPQERKGLSLFDGTIDGFLQKSREAAVHALDSTTAVRRIDHYPVKL